MSNLIEINESFKMLKRRMWRGTGSSTSLLLDEERSTPPKKCPSSRHPLIHVLNNLVSKIWFHIGKNILYYELLN